jgi:outer membrane receptor protein involved in Fe transport
MISSGFKLTLFGAAAFALSTAAALAQTSSGSGPPPGSASAGSGSETELAEVIVTATRRTETLQTVPGEVTALTGKDLGAMNARDLADFAAFVPGLSYASEGPSSTLIVIRGVTTGSQLSSAIGLYLDDIPIGASTSFGLGYQNLNVNTYDLARVEVLNGPQGTLYGASSLGGTLKYVTAPPALHDFSAEANAEISTTHEGSVSHAYRGYLNLPLGEGLAALRLDAFQEYDAGYGNDPVYHRNYLGSAQPEGARGSLLIEPLEGLDIRLSALTQRITGAGADVGFRSPVTHEPTLGTFGQAYPTYQPSISTLNLYSLVIDYDTPIAKITSITGNQINHGLSSTDESYVYQAALADFGGGTAPWSLYVNTVSKKTTEELRLVSHENEWVNWILGGFYDSETTSEVVNLFDEANPGGTFFGLPPFDSHLPSTYKEYAVYGDATVIITHQFDVGLGVRYSRQKQTYDEAVSGLLATGSSFVLIPPLATSNQSVTTYLVNPKYRITDDVMVYARAASGFRPGGPNFVLAPGLGNPTFGPDRLWNYELGEKSSVLDRRATLDFDVYDIEWKDIQVTVNNGGVNQLENAGNARVDGAELAFNFRVVPAFTLGGSAAYTNARLTTTAPVLAITTTGARLPLSPKFNFALIASYDFHLSEGYSGTASVTDRWLGDRPTAFGTPVSPQYVLAGYNTTDVNLTLHAPHGWDINLFARNLFDKIGEVSAATIANEYNPAAPVPVFLSQPRTVGLGAKVKFD